LNFDALIIGADSAVSTSAYYSLLNNNKDLRVALFDKKLFPRNKQCGDSWKLDDQQERKKKRLLDSLPSSTRLVAAADWFRLVLFL